MIRHSGLHRSIRRPISRAVTAPPVDDHCRRHSWRSLSLFSACETVAVRGRRALAELRTTLTGVDPGLVRLRLASIGTASMMLAAAVMAGVRALSGQPVTVELFAAVIAMISNLAVNEPDVPRLRVTTLLMLGPAAVSIVAGTLLAPHGVVEDKLSDLQRRRAQLNDTALLLADSVEQRGADHRGAVKGRDAGEGDGEAFTLDILDAELAAEGLAVATERLAQREAPLDAGSRRALLAGLQGLGAASATGTPPATVAALLGEARRSVSALAAETQGRRDRSQRAAFAVIRLADALEAARRADGAAPARDDPAARPPKDRTDGPGDSHTGEDAATTTDVDEPLGLALSTRQAIQVGIATSLAIVVGELVSPARWYWAVLTAFLIFAGTSSRGDVLSRGSQRIVGTIGGVLAGMGLAVLVSGHELVSLLVMLGC